MSENYYEAKNSENGYRGHIYRYKPDGNHTETVWLSTRAFDTSEEAEDAACVYADENGIEIELG